MSPRARLLLAAAAAAAMTIFCATRLRVTTDITHFLPSGSDHRLAGLSRQLADSSLTRTLILSVAAPDAEAARAAAAALAARLVSLPEVAFVQRGPTPELAQSVYALYGPRLASFVSERPEAEIPVALDDAHLAAAARALKTQLGLPLAPLLTRMAPADPLQWFPAILRRFERAQAGTLEVDGDQLVTPDHRHAILFVGTRHSPFDSAAQAPLLAAIDTAFAALNTGGTLTLERGGVAPIAVDAERRIRGDLERLSIFSTLGVLLVFWSLFRSLRGLVLAILPIVSAALTGTTIGILLFGQLHGMTLAIGSTLVGVAVDYPILLLTHRALAPGEAPASVARRVSMGLLLGALTTATGFAAMAWTSFPGVREMAVTCSVGILAALVVTRFVLPLLMGGAPSRAPLLTRGAAVGARALAWLEAHPRLRVGGVLGIALLCLVGLPRLRWLDALAALNPADPALRAETDRVRARVSRMDEGRFVIALARDEESALRLNDQIATRLDAAQKDGVLEASASVHAFLWSEDLQRRNRAAVAASPRLGARTLEALRHEGFKPEAFARGADALSAPLDVPPLRAADLLASPLGALVRPFFVKLGDETGVLTFVRGVKDPARLAAAVADLPGVQVFDQTLFLDQVYARFRVQTLQAIAIGLVLIFFVHLVRYRRWRHALGALLPALFAVLATLGILGALGVRVTLIHALSLLIIISVGIDYGVFLVECVDGGGLGPTAMSLVASFSTALFSFGLLALSGTPALRAIGLTTAIGITASLLFSPLALALIPRGEVKVVS
ncbi:MAG TPA: MMPL family transporter [Polyangia bacterium]|nr:MMPL family transporter [Polyangia bacterium]